MISQTFKNFSKFYQVSLVFIMLLTIGSIFYFWNKGFIDGSRTQDLHQASFLLESLTKKNQFEEIKNQVHQESPKLALKKIKAFEEEISTIDRQVSVSEFDNLQTSLQSLKTSIAKLISFSKTDQVITVFSKKLDKFNRFVKDSNWRTLTRMSERISLQVSGHLNKNKLSDLANSIKNEFEQMITITENSVLARKDKSEVVSRLNNLNFEMNMLGRYAMSRNSFDKNFKKTNKAMNLWTDKVAPEITFSKLEMQEIGRYYVMGMLMTLLLTALLFVTSFFYNNWFMTRASLALEEKLESFITEGLVGGDASYLVNFSRNFQAYAQNMMGYIDKRMSFGSVFQDALPLSSILLDQNLKVVWSNQQFCDGWNISEDEIQKDYMSWDYLNKLTNIGGDDPILEALKNDVAGIYQIQIKPDDKADARPFEMFVSPVKYKNEKRVMLFFYDLTNLEETIQDQGKSILNPVKESLALMRKGGFEPNEQLEYEFSISGTTDLYDSFVKLNEETSERADESQLEREYLYGQINEFDQKVLNMLEKNTKNMEIGEQNIKALKTFKDSVISLSDLSKNLDESVQKKSEIIGMNLRAMRGSVQKIANSKEIVMEIFEGLPKLEETKNLIKVEKSNLQEKRAKLEHELSQLGMLMKRTTDVSGLSKLNRTFDKIQTTFEHYSLLSKGLDKKLATLDIYMSKTQMILASSQGRLQQVDTVAEQEQIQSAQDIIDLYSDLSRNSESLNASYEEEIVMALQRIFKGTKSSLRNFAEIQESNTDEGTHAEGDYCVFPSQELS